MSQFKLGILGRTLKEVLPSACPVFSWRSQPMVLLPHCPEGCSRGSPLCLQSSCPAHWDGALVSEVSGSYLWWISSRSGQCGSPGVTLCRIRVGTCRLRLRLPSFSCVLDMEASANVDAQGMGGSLDGPTFWLPSSGLFPPQRRDLSDSSRLGSTHNDRTPGVAWLVPWTAGQKLLALGSRRTCGWLLWHGLPLKLPVPRVAWKRESKVVHESISQQLVGLLFCVCTNHLLASLFSTVSSCVCVHARVHARARARACVCVCEVTDVLSRDNLTSVYCFF